ncbi:secreted arabinase [Ephemerocybe angulata]|uniref:Arabinan endo-1,5-alpha-L-arabinosidase n=1 Tax=Ephemerocybe angulata TaxID=980116 RepID=A0A8H6MEZ0_9AGAR|nr:secreted arabinase [Tulosesus angulatus]
MVSLNLKSSLLFVASALGALVSAVPNPGTVTGNIAVHDPTLCRDGSGKYWLFSTGPGIEIRTSTDRIAWTLVGAVFPNGAATWTNEYTGKNNGDLWAPDCYYQNGELLLYYAASSFGSQKSAIFLAKSSSGNPGTWSNLGLVTATTPSNDYNAIDANLVIDNGQWYLSLGSFWTGIKLININSSTGKPSSSSLTSLARRTAAGGAIEASSIYKNGNFFYLFTSWDKCCSGTSSTYNIRVGRSSSVNGPYVDKSGVALTSGGGTLVLGSHDAIIGPGGQDVYTDADGPILVYHHYTSSGSSLGINRLDFSSGWPVVV